MKIDLKEADALVRELTVEVPAETVNVEMDKKFVDIRRQADIKGFRKGKVPMPMIRSMYDNEVRQQVTEELIRSSLREAVREKDLNLAGPPIPTAVDYNESGDLVYTVKLEVLPELENVKFEGLELPKSDIVVADEEVDEVVEFFRVRFSDSRAIDRPAEAEDVVIVDMAKKDDPRKVVEQDKFADVEIDLAKGTTVREFKDQIPGMKVGDIREIKVEYGDEYPDERFAGAHVTYDCTLKEVKERIKPAFDDALAKRTGQAETALELRLKIREDLEREQREVQANRHRGEIIRQVCKLNPIPVPDGLVEEYLESMTKEYKTKYPEADETEIKKGYHENAVNTIRWNLLYHKLADQEKIEVSTADTEKWIKGFAEANKMEVERATEILNQSGRIQNLRESILEQKTLDFLMGHTRIVEADDSAKQEETKP